MTAILSIIMSVLAALLPSFVSWLEGKMQQKPMTNAEIESAQRQQLKVLSRDAINSKDPAKILTVFGVHDGLLRDATPASFAASAISGHVRVEDFTNQPNRVHSNRGLVAQTDGIRSNPSASTSGVRGSDIAGIIAAGRQRR